MHMAATIERAEKQILLARHGRRLLSLLDDTPLVPGETRSNYVQQEQGRQIMDEAENDLKEWEPRLEPISMQSGRSGQQQNGDDLTNGDHEEESSYQKDEVE